MEKLKFIDEQFDELYPKRPKFESLEGKLTGYRRELEEQHQEEMTLKVSMVNTCWMGRLLPVLSHKGTFSWIEALYMEMTTTVSLAGTGWVT